MRYINLSGAILLPLVDSVLLLPPSVDVFDARDLAPNKALAHF